MPTSRREFLRAGAGAALGASAWDALVARFGLVNAQTVPEAASDYRALVCLFLGGGNDPWNTIVNLDQYASYAQVRGSVALPQGSLVPIQPQSGGSFGLHPGLGPLAPLFAQGRLAVVANVGTLARPLTRPEYLAHPEWRPPNLFSHSDQVQQWHGGMSAPLLVTGWGGRTGDHTRELNLPTAFPMISSISGAPLFGIGTATRPLELTSSGSVGLSGFSSSTSSQIRYNALRQLLTLDRDRTFVRAAGDVLGRAIGADQQLSQALAQAPALQTVFPNTNVANQLKMVARIISVRQTLQVQRQIFFCSLSGFDTHQGQLVSQQDLLTQVGAALAAFHQSTLELSVAHMVTTFTSSDFGRTLKPNGGGTDHAWGTCQFVMGGAVNGGRFYGQWPTLALGGPDDSGSSGRFIPTTSVDQFAATLARWYGLAAADVPSVFPNLSHFDPADLGFMW